MKVPKKISRFFREPPKTLFDDLEDVTAEAPVEGPLFSNPMFYALLAIFGISLMLTADWLGLLLLNSEGVFGRIGPLNTVRVTAILMTGIAIPSALLMFHYKRLYSYIWMKKASGVRHQASGWSGCLTGVRPQTALLKPETCSLKPNS
jgi:hypothetical protein